MQIAADLRIRLGGSDGDGYGQLRYLESEDELLVETIFIPSAWRNRGLGDRLLRRVLILADAQSKNVRLLARPIGRSGVDATARLVRYYERYSFTVVSDGRAVPTMIRTPQKNGGYPSGRRDVP